MTRQEDIEVFMQELCSLPSAMRRIRHCIVRRNALFASYAPTSAHTVMTDYRNTIRAYIEQGLLPRKALSWFRKSRKQTIERRKYTRKQLKTDLMHGREIHKPDEVISIAQNLLSSNSYIDIGLGIMLLTGRRPYEVFKTAIFTMTDNPYSIIFEGQAKTKDRIEGKKPYPIPIFEQANIIIQALERLRGLRDFSAYDHKQFHNTISKTLGEKFRKHFGQLLPGCKPTHLRSLYSVLAHEVFAPQHHYFESYAAEILGHGEDDTYTAESYKDFHFVRQSLLSENL